MKLATSNTVMEISGGSNVSSFSIAMNGKAFRVLSDTLYQNKIGSIVREISCNAYDAHIMAGKTDVPFVVHIPDAFEPWFSVQDFGVGLSPEEIVNVFTVYFQSTKDNSNEAIGAFGLGAKTPFSYTDQFTVTSVKNGMRRIYNAYITDTGVPSIIEMDCGPTNDINGVEIKLSVKSGDFAKFRDEVSKQLRFFKVKPQIKNCKNFQFPELMAGNLVSNEHVSVSSKSPGYGESSVYIIQGNVGYPLDMSQAKEKLSKENLAFINYMNGHTTYIYFDIGQIGVTASREGVEYNNTTIANINAKLDIARTEVEKYVRAEINNKKTDWEKAEFINSSSVISRLAAAASVVVSSAQRSTYGDTLYFDFTDILEDTSNKAKNAFGKVYFARTSRWVNGRTSREKCDAKLTPGSNRVLAIVLRDTANRPNMRAKHYLSELLKTQDGMLMEIEFNEYSQATDAFIAKLKDALGGYSNIKRLSDIELPVVDNSGNRVRSSYTRPTYYAISSAISDWNVRNWVREFDAIKDIQDETLYFTIKDMIAVSGRIGSYSTNYVRLVNQLKETMPNVIAVREGDVEKAKANPNLVDFFEYMDNKIKNLDGNIKFKLDWIKNNVRQKVRKLTDLDSLSGCDFVQELEAISPNNKLIRLCKFASDRFDVNYDRKLDGLAVLCGWGTDDVLKRITVRAEKIEKAYDALAERLPFVKLYNEWYVRNVVSAKHMAEYVAKMGDGA
jgi:Histidine kinase-, DNA gyrase B-, and HSP90-like ATPase